MKRLNSTLLAGLCGLFGLPASALPTDFVDRVEAALLCRSDWSTAFWQDYFNRTLQTPLRDWGEARWWNAQGAKLGGVTAQEVFTNLDTSSALMVGILIQQPLDEVRKTVEATTGTRFSPVSTADGIRYVSATASVLAGVSDQQSTKWYCARWNMGNRP